MKLTRVELKDYRCFADTTLIVDPHATVLMGPNDVGKTYLLRALAKFGAMENFSNDAVRKVSSAEGRSGQMELTFQFSSFNEGEIAYMQNFGVELKPDDCLSLTRSGPRNADKPQVLLNGALLREIMSGNFAAEPECAPSKEDANGNGVPPTEQSTEMTDLDTAPDESPGELTRMSDEDWAGFLSGLFAILPAIELLPQLAPLPFEVNVAQLGADDPKMETVRTVLQLGGIDDLSMLSQDTAEREELLEDASQRITQVLRQYWTQDKKIDLKARASGDKLRFHILVRGYPAFTRPQWHSPAFGEYLALMAALLLRIRATEQPSILLLDEPGIRLHPRAQRDLTQLFRKLSQRAQLIYTAHYPYLIDRNFPGQLRLLEPKPVGTEINNKPYHPEVYPLAWESIRTVLGLTVGDSLLFDDYNVIVEGITDQLLLCAISQELSEVGDDRALDLNHTAVLPAGGASQEADLAKRALAHDLLVVALFDGEKACEREINSFKRTVRDAPDPLWLREFYNVGYDFSIEDMLPTQLYLEAVNRSYQTWYKAYTPIELKQLQGRKKSIVEVLEELLPLAIAGGLEEARPPEQDSDQETQNAKEPKSNRAEILGASEEAFHLSKVEVAKEAIRLLRDGGIRNKKGELRREYERFAALFAEMKERLKVPARKGGTV